MDERLYINGELVDLGESKIVRKLQTNDVAEVGAIKSSFSYTISLPMTSKNKSILDMLSAIGNTSRKPYEVLTCNYIVDGIYLVENGAAIVKESNNTYKVNIIDGGAELSSVLGEQTVRDLDFSEYNHNVTVDDVVDSLTNTSGYIYAIGDYKNETVDDNINVRDIVPSIFVHTIVEKIFEENGITANGDFFTTDSEYLNELVTPSNGYDNDYNDSVQIGNIVTDDSQVNIIKDTCQRHGLVVNKVGLKEYDFIKIDNILDSNDVEDWSNKLSEITNEKYKVDLSKYNYVKYNDWDTGFTRTRPVGGKYYTDAEYYVEIDDENLQEEDDLFISIFRMLKSSRDTSGITKPVYEALLWDDSGEPLEITSYIASVARLTQDITFTSSTDSEVVNNAAILSIEDVKAKDIVERSYTNYQLLMNDYREKTMILKLSPIDIYTLRFDKLKYFKQTGRRYYLNSVQYQAGQTAKAVLIELN